MSTFRKLFAICLFLGSLVYGAYLVYLMGSSMVGGF